MFKLWQKCRHLSTANPTKNLRLRGRMVLTDWPIDATHLPCHAFSCSLQRVEPRLTGVVFVGIARGPRTSPGSPRNGYTDPRLTLTGPGTSESPLGRPTLLPGSGGERCRRAQ